MEPKQENGGTAYGPGGWRSRRREAVRPEIRRAVALVARDGEREDGPAPGGDAKLLAHYVGPLLGRFSATADRRGRWWYKIGWRVAGDPVYIAVSYDTPTSAFAALVDLCELLEEIARGLRKPSPDVYRG